MENRSERSRQLLKRMILHEPKLRVPDKASEVIDNNRAVKMIILCGCLDYAMIDLENDLRDAGVFRQQLKKNYNLANKLVINCHDIFFNLLANNEFAKAARQYNEHVDRTYENIENSMSLPPLESSYNKVLSLCRLALKYNDKLKGRYDCECIYRLANVPRLLQGIEVKDYNLDFLIESQISYK